MKITCDYVYLYHDTFSTKHCYCHCGDSFIVNNLDNNANVQFYAKMAKYMYSDSHLAKLIVKRLILLFAPRKNFSSFKITLCARRVKIYGLGDLF